jgi:hypothetical protein
MKINGFAILTLLSLAFGGDARRGNRFRAYDEDNPIEQRSRVTAFVNTEKGLKVECWEVGDLLPDTSSARRIQLARRMSVNIYTFPPSSNIYSTGVHTNAIDFRQQPNLFTVKDGIVFIEARPMSGGDVAARRDDYDQYVFADVNGDDWFYFEDQTYTDDSHEQCASATYKSSLEMQTISGSDTTLINFEYESTPRHTVVHEGRCEFAGLKPVSQPSQGDARFRSQELK